MRVRHDTLARPANPEASRHTVKPSPRYCLRKCPNGFLYLIPFIYAYGWDQLTRQWEKDCQAANMRVRTARGGTLQRLSFNPPAYAEATDMSRLTFESPLEIPSDV